MNRWKITYANGQVIPIYKKSKEDIDLKLWSDIGEIESITPYTDTSHEKYIEKIKKQSEFLGYDNYNYEDFYVFTDNAFNGKTYTLRLNLNKIYDMDRSQRISPYYYVVLYHITPEFYHFVSTIGSIQTSDLAKSGLSNITPNVGNVSGGIGMAAGYAAAKSKPVRHIYEE